MQSLKYRLGSNRNGYGRERLCQEIETQLLESDRIRNIRKATSLNELYELFGIPNHVIDGFTPKQSSLSKKLANPISPICSETHTLSSVSNSKIVDVAGEMHGQYDSSSVSMRQTNHSRPLRQRITSNTTSHKFHRRCRLDKPHSKSSIGILDSPHRRYSFRNNRIDSEEPLKSIEHELDKGANDDNNDMANGSENLEWYIRLASRCYRDGFQWHADYLLGKCSQLEKKQLTRRPLLQIIERHLEQRSQGKEETLRCVSLSPQVAIDNPSSRPIQSIRSTTLENNREYDIRIQISPSGDKNRLPQQIQAHKTPASSEDIIFDQTISCSSSDNNKQDLSVSKLLIDDFSSLKIDEQLAVAHHNLPQIWLTDCCSNTFVCHDNDPVKMPTSTSFCLSTQTSEPYTSPKNQNQ